MFTCILTTFNYYESGRTNYSPLTWVGYIAGIVFIILAYLPFHPSRLKGSQILSVMKENKVTILIFILLSLMFFVTYFMNFHQSAWGMGAIYDDAAWDLYSTIDYVMAGKPFQAAIPIPISVDPPKETLYMYYCAFIFKIFGANLLVFNVSLIFLGFFTFIFTTLLVWRIFKNHWLTCIAAVVTCFFPVIHGNIFCGHRYALAFPLFSASLYFLYTGYEKKAPFPIIISAILGGFFFSCAPMGKQYFFGLGGAIFLALLFNRKQALTAANVRWTRLFITGVVVSALPIIIYILFNYQKYMTVESYYTQPFFESLKNQGLAGLNEYIDRMNIALFQPSDYGRRFCPNFVLVPFPYYLLIIPGFILAFVRRHYSLVTLAIIPFISAFVSSKYFAFHDYRTLMAVPIWVVFMVFTIDFLLKRFGWKKDGKSISNLGGNRFGEFIRISFPWLLAFLLCTGLILGGLIPSIRHIQAVARDPYSITYLNPMDVAIMRYLRDIAAGVPDPSPKLRWNELNKLEDLPEPNYETLICQQRCFAIAYLFLHDYDAHKILSFHDGIGYETDTEEGILNTNKKAIQEYPKGNKDLKLVWELSDLVNPVVQKFRELRYLGSEQELSFEFTGRKISFYVLNIKNEMIDQFKEAVQTMK